MPRKQPKRAGRKPDLLKLQEPYDKAMERLVQAPKLPKKQKPAAQ